LFGDSALRGLEVLWQRGRRLAAALRLDGDDLVAALQEKGDLDRRTLVGGPRPAVDEAGRFG